MRVAKTSMLAGAAQQQLHLERLQAPDHAREPHREHGRRQHRHQHVAEGAPGPQPAHPGGFLQGRFQLPHGGHEQDGHDGDVLAVRWTQMMPVKV